MARLQSLDITIPAGEQRQFDIAGEVVSCSESNFSGFKLAIEDQAFFDFGQGFKIRPAGEFKQFTVKNTESSALTATIYVGFGDIEDYRSVTSTPQGVALSTLQEHREGLYQARLQQALTVGQTSNVELFNPATSTKTLLLRRLYLTTSSATTISISIGAGARLSTADSGDAKRVSDGGSGAAETRADTDGPGIATGANVLRNQVTMSTGALEHVCDDPFPIEPGRSLYAFTTGDNVTLQLFAHYQEVLA